MDTKNNYDRIGRLYNLLSASFESRYREEALNSLSVKPGDSILEIGYGSGHSLLKIAQAAGETGRVTGIDKSTSMFRICRNRIRRKRLENRIDLKCTDIMGTVYKKETFDGIFMSFTLETFSREKRVYLLNKAREWLKPGGRICILAMSESEEMTLLYRLYLWSHRKFPRLVDCQPINPEKILKEAGLTIRETKELKIYRLPVAIALAGK